MKARPSLCQASRSTGNSAPINGRTSIRTIGLNQHRSLERSGSVAIHHAGRLTVKGSIALYADSGGLLSDTIHPASILVSSNARHSRRLGTAGEQGTSKIPPAHESAEPKRRNSHTFGFDSDRFERNRETLRGSTC